MDAHPSFLQLDRARLGAPNREVAVHLAACPSCQAHLQRVEARPPAQAPALAARLAPQRGRSRRRSLTLWIPVALTAALVVSVTLNVAPTAEPARTTAKGAPRVALYLKRGDAVALWDGHSPVLAGDRLRLQVAPEGFRYLVVLSPGQSEPLYAGPVDPKQPTFLPESWRVDDSPDDERLVLALSQRPLDTNELEAARSRLRRDAEVWTTALTLPKTAPEPTEDPRP